MASVARDLERIVFVVASAVRYLKRTVFFVASVVRYLKRIVYTLWLQWLYTHMQIQIHIQIHRYFGEAGIPCGFSG